MENSKKTNKKSTRIPVPGGMGILRLNRPDNPIHLRRRSKSVAHLSSISSRPKTALTSTSKNNVILNANKIVQNQQLTIQKSSEEIRPKVLKRKIPDWDYKSRFLELKKKHELLSDNFKSSKNEFNLNCKQMEEKHREKDLEINSLKTQLNGIMCENRSLLKENSKIKNDFIELYKMKKGSPTYREKNI